MSVCVECGDFELFYVPACGDPAVGESNILLFAGEELTALQQEIREIDGLFGELEDAKAEGDPQCIIDAQDHVAQTLSGHIPMLDGYTRPMARLPGDHLVQAYSIKGKKWTFIRSDKMRNHWRSYNVDKSLLQARGASDDPKQLNRQGLRSAFSSASQKIKDDLKEGITFRTQIAKGSVAGAITDLWDVSWLQWVDAVNDSLVYSGKSGYHDLSAGAQLLRGYAGYGLNLGYNPKTAGYGLTGNAEARAVLAEAKAQFDGYVPHRDGWYAFIPHFNQVASEPGRESLLNFGYFRGHIKITAHAMLGAAIFGTAGIEYVPEEEGKLLVKPSMAGAKGEVAVGAFAGVEAGGSASGALEWLNPGWCEEADGEVKDKKWAIFIELGVMVAANAGIGGEVDFAITFENGKFMFRAKAQLVIGVGAKGSFTGLVGVGAIYDFVMYVYHQLKDNDFAKLNFITEEAFNAVVTLVLYGIEFGTEALQYVGDQFDRVVEQLQSYIAAPDEAEAYAKRIKERPEILFFAPPEAKGAVLYRLSETFLFSFEEHQEAAILTVVGTIQSQREWEQVVERITPTGAKSTAAAGMERLRWIMDGGSSVKFQQMLRAIAALPPRTVMAGEPVIIRNIA